MSGAFAHLLPARTPTIAEQVQSYKHARLGLNYTGSESEVQASEDRWGDAENMLLASLTALGIDEEDARRMVWGLA